MYIIYIRVRYCFSLVYTSKMAIKCYELKVDVQKGALRFRGKYDNRCVSFIHFKLSSIICLLS